MLILEEVYLNSKGITKMITTIVVQATFEHIKWESIVVEVVVGKLDALIQKKIAIKR